MSDKRPAKRAKPTPPTQVEEVFTPANAASAAESLRIKGFAVVSHPRLANTLRWREDIDLQIQAFPEYLSDAADKFPLGGFSCYGNPGSFHNCVVRELRLTAYEAISPVLDDLIGDSGKRKEAIIDRLMVRPIGRAPSRDTWHRDEAPNAIEGDTILGGWYNFSEGPSYFVCAQGSHIGVVGHRGFAKMTDEEANKLQSRRVKVTVPSGCIIVFNELIAHEIYPEKQKNFVAYRLFLGWRITSSKIPLDPQLQEKIAMQAAMSLKSGQESAIYPKLYFVNHFPKLLEYSKNFVQPCLEETKRKSKSGEVETHIVVHRFMKSLTEYGLYREEYCYASDDLAILIPHERI